MSWEFNSLQFQKARVISSKTCLWAQKSLILNKGTKTWSHLSLMVIKWLRFCLENMSLKQTFILEKLTFNYLELSFCLDHFSLRRSFSCLLFNFFDAATSPLSFFFSSPCFISSNSFKWSSSSASSTLVSCFCYACNTFVKVSTYDIH